MIPPRLKGQRWMVTTSNNEKVVIEIISGYPQSGSGLTEIITIQLWVKDVPVMKTSDDFFQVNKIRTLHFSAPGWSYEILSGQEKPL